MNDADTPRKADLLLDALVAYWRERLTGERFDTVVVEGVDRALADARQLTLNQVVTADQIASTAHKYATQRTIEGSIPELVGEIAARVYAKTVDTRDPLNQLVDQRQFEEIATTLTDLGGFRRLVDRVYESEITTRLVAWVLYRAVVADNLRRAERIPGFQTVDLRLQELSERVVRFLHDRVRSAEAAGGAETFVDAALTLWDEHADDPIASFGEIVTADDIEDVLVLVFEFWFRFRKTEYFREVLYEGVGYFFEKYGDATLADLLADIGVSRDDMIEEARRFGPPVIDVLVANGMFDEIVRSTHADFFASPQVAAILAD